MNIKTSNETLQRIIEQLKKELMEAKLALAGRDEDGGRIMEGAGKGRREGSESAPFLLRIRLANRTPATQWGEVSSLILTLKVFLNL